MATNRRDKRDEQEDLEVLPETTTVRLETPVVWAESFEKLLSDLRGLAAFTVSLLSLF